MEFLDCAQQCAQEAADAASKVLKKYWGKLKSVETKSAPSDLVTIADKESEEAIIRVIRSYFPDHAILGEESGLEDRHHSPYQWIIDPLDGTTNYTHGYPMVAISIALYYQMKPLVALVQNPLFNETFYAQKNRGAYGNGKKLSVSKTHDLSSALLATGFAYDRLKTPETNYIEFAYFTQLTQGVRRLGAAALDLAYVAAGRLDGYWERGLKPWDMAAGVLLIEEAGGKTSSYDTSPLDLSSGKILATNGRLHEAISAELMKLKRLTK